MATEPKSSEDEETKEPAFTHCRTSIEDSQAEATPNQCDNVSVPTLVIARMHEQGMGIPAISTVLGVTIDEVVAALTTKDSEPESKSSDADVRVCRLATTLTQRLRSDPRQFLCPVLHDLMLDPVVAEDGHTYERDAILQVLQKNGKSPMTNASMGMQVFPNRALKSQVMEFRDRTFQDILQLCPNMSSEDAALLLRRADELVRPLLPNQEARRQLIDLLRLKIRLLPDMRGSVTGDLLLMVVDTDGVLPADVLSELLIEPDALRDLPTRVLCYLAESLVQAVRLADAARVLVLAANKAQQEGQTVVAAQQYVRAFALDRSNNDAADGVVALCPSVLDNIVDAQRTMGSCILNFGAGLLKPSLKGTQAVKQVCNRETNADLRPVQELQDSESAVTCICFGQERLHRTYVLLATASKDGTVVIYRCYRTEMEIDILPDAMPEVFPSDISEPATGSVAVHSRLVGHARAITSMFFNLLDEDQLVTTSIDKSVRFWAVDSGEMLKVFTGPSPVTVAALLPSNPEVFVAANSNAVLRLVNVQGVVLQTLSVENEVWALKFDDTGLFLLAGTKSGSINVLEASDSSTLINKFKVQVARGGITCIIFVPASYGQPPCLLVNASDSSVTIIDCTYNEPSGALTNLSIRHRVSVAHSLLALKCCYSPSGQGYLISGSEDKQVYIYSLAQQSNYKMQKLKHHQVPVIDVAVNMQDTLLASADSLGHVVLWRRMDFSHLHTL